MDLTSIFGQLLSIGGIAGVIAVIITVSICARYVKHGPEEIPQVLAYALTTILGFYFGAGVSIASSAAGGP